MKPPVKKVVVYVVDFARNAIKMGRGAALRQISILASEGSLPMGCPSSKSFYHVCKSVRSVRARLLCATHRVLGGS